VESVGSVLILVCAIEFGGQCLLSWGCHNRAPQTGLLKTVEICSLTVLEAGVQDQAIFYEDKSVPCLSPWQLAAWTALGCSFFLSLHITFPIGVSVFAQISTLCKDLSIVGLGLTPVTSSRLDHLQDPLSK
jgi:hypothetical protein